MGHLIDGDPAIALSQANDVFRLSVLFKPKADTLARLAKFAVPGAAPGTVEIPMKLTVPDQKLPVCFSIRAQVRATAVCMCHQSRSC